MIGRLLRGGFMTAIYAYLYIPIIILIVNSFNRSRFGINWQGFTTDLPACSSSIRRIQ